MNFIELREKTQLKQIVEDSNSLPMGALIFKHSTRCAISHMVLNRFRRSWDVSPGKLPVYYLDLIRYRDISDQISQTFNVEHESPQVLLIKGGESVYSVSHNMISPENIKEKALNG